MDNIKKIDNNLSQFESFDKKSNKTKSFKTGQKVMSRNNQVSYDWGESFARTTQEKLYRKQLNLMPNQYIVKPPVDDSILYTIDQFNQDLYIDRGANVGGIKNIETLINPSLRDTIFKRHMLFDL